MIVTATEAKLNFGYYLKIAEKEDVFVTKNGKPAVKISSVKTSALDKLDGVLVGKVPVDIDRKKIREARLEEA